MLSMLHGWLHTSEHVSGVLAEVLRASKRKQIFDFCSGDGRLMMDVHRRLIANSDLQDVKLQLSDLYPNQETQKQLQSQSDSSVDYYRDPVDATGFIETNHRAVRTLICGFHHMPPEQSKQILKQAVDCGDPIVVYEISDNSFPPKYLWWIGLPLNLVFGFVVAAMVRPMTLKHFLFSFVVPAIPVCFAWDGAVSNIRTYTKSDIAELIADIPSDGYTWEVRSIEAKPSRHICLIGMPNTDV